MDKHNKCKFCNFQAEKRLNFYLNFFLLIVHIWLNIELIREINSLCELRIKILSIPSL